MLNYFLHLSLIIVGLYFLVKTANYFIHYATQLAMLFNVSPLLIGIFIIGFGTSAPEMIVSVFSSIEGNSQMALGNTVGSNISNIALILGLTCTLSPVAINSKLIKSELPILLGSTIVVTLLLLDLTLSRFDSMLLISMFIALLIWSLYFERHNQKDNLNQDQHIVSSSQNESLTKVLYLLLLNLILLILSSKVLVYGAANLATALGVSDIIIGLTIVAVGTSLPEFVSSIIASKQGRPDLVMGNIIGSNLFNILAVTGVSGLIAPIKITHEIYMRDILTMLFTTLLLSMFLWMSQYKKSCLGVKQGFIMLLSYILYLSFLLHSSIN